MSLAWFLTGTDTGIGKTTVATLLLKSLSALGMATAGMKPVAAGCTWEEGRWVNEDVRQLARHSTVRADWRDVSPYAFAPAIAPHLAAIQSGQLVRFEVILSALNRLRAQADAVVIEGAGGFRVPLGPDGDMADLCRTLETPAILVVGMRLGCLNHAFLTVESILNRGIHLDGWVANRIDPEMPAFEPNLDALKRGIPAPCLGVIPYLRNGQEPSVALRTDILLK